MKIHHLNLGTMCPFGGRLVTGGNASVFSSATMVAHALLVESPEGLVLIDTGIGLADIAAPSERLGRPFVAMSRPELREDETAIRQVERLGFSARDVRHIVVTHLDPDHAGGLSDFPEAKVHVHQKELEAARTRQTRGEQGRYRTLQWDHGPRWETHVEDGERWFGLERVRAVTDDVLLIPLFGHTRGHAGVAVRTHRADGPEWLLHCGDSYFFHGQMEEPESCPWGLMSFQKLVAVDEALRVANVARLRALHREQGERVRLFSAHCAVEFARLAGTS